MGRTPSPSRRRRSRSRDRVERAERDRDRKRRRSRSRERREPEHRRDRKRSGEREFRRKSWSRSRSRSPDKQRYNKQKQQPAKPNISAADLEGKTEEEQDMLKMMGFCGFNTTKNTKVEENNAGEVHVILKRKYRQYMNRKGGFNRPLDFVA